MGKKLTQKDAEDRLKKNNPSVLFLDQYFGSEEKSEFICLICGKEWEANARGVINGNNGCPECGKIKAKKTVKHNITTEEFKEKIKKIYKDKLSVLGEYKSSDSKIEVKCNVCNYKWSPKSKYLIAGYGCYDCGHKSKGEKHRKTHEKFLEEIKEIHDNRIQVLGEYNTGADRIEVQCSVCNYIWKPVARGLLRRGCPKCNFSKGEMLISKILKKIGVNFESQYIFSNLRTERDGIPIFDFVIFDETKRVKTIIEYDGEQHFKPVKKWGGVKRLEEQQKVDKFKEEFCKKNNIKLIRVPYFEYKKIDLEYIKNKIYE